MDRLLKLQLRGRHQAHCGFLVQVRLPAEVSSCFLMVPSVLSAAFFARDCAMLRFNPAKPPCSMFPRDRFA